MTTLAEQSADPVTASRARGRRVAHWAVFLGFVVVVAVTMTRHEMWRDELQAWMIVRSSSSLTDLLHNVRYEGHPLLWYASLLPLSSVGRGPATMQVLQLVVATLAMAVFVFRAPFTLPQKALFAGSYFAVYEYGVLSRGYSLGLLYVMAICALAAFPARRWPWTGILLGALALTSAFGAILALALGLGLGVDEAIRRRRGDTEVSSVQLLAFGGAISVASLLWAYAQTIPPTDSGVFRRWNTDFDSGLAGSSLASVWRALAPLPRFQREFWNTNVLDGNIRYTALIGVALVIGVAWLLRRRPGALVTWLTGASGTVLFLYGKIGYASASRHYGHIFVAFVAALFLAPSMATASADRPDVSANTRSALFTGVLTIQLMAGLVAVSLDLGLPFSNGRDVASYIRREGLENSIIVGEPDIAASTVAAYLDRNVYYPASGRFGSYIIWDRQRVEPGQPLTEVLRRLARRDAEEPVLVLLNRPVDGPLEMLELLAKFDDGIVADEHFWLYRLSPRALRDQVDNDDEIVTESAVVGR